MMLSVMVVGAWAAFSDQSKIKNTEAVDMCTALNIIGGYPDGTFKPEGNITRAEVTKMICVALNGGKEPAVSTNSTPTFNDVRTNANAAWAEGFIESCAAQGIVSGVGAGKFNPAGNVTGVQLAKMLLVALGYKSDIENFTGNAWATNVNVRAAQKGLYEDLEKMDTNAAITRDNAAQMVWNALKAKEVEYDYTLVSENGQLVSKTTLVDKNKTLMADKYSANDEHEGTLVGFTYNDTKGEWTYYVQESSTAGVAPVQYKSTKDFTSLYRQYVSIVYKEKTNQTVDSVYGIYADADDCQVLATGLIGDLDDISSDKDSVKIDGTSYDLAKKASETPVYYFEYGATATSEVDKLKTLENAETLDPFQFTAIDLNSDNDIDLFVVYPYAVGQVNLLNKSKIGIKDMDKSNAIAISTVGTSTTANGTVSIDLDDVDTYKDVAKDDYVVYTPAKYTATNKATIKKVSTVLSNTVSRVSGSDVTIDGKTYTNYNKTATYTAGSKVSDAVIVNDYIFLVDSTGTVNADDYAVVVNATNGVNSVSGKQAKLLFSDGSKVIVDTKANYTGLVGKLVTYTKNSSDEYTLTAAVVDAKDVNNTGFDAIVAPSAGVDYDKQTISITGNDVSSSKVKYISGNAIADDAVIFVKAEGGDTYKVITGAQLKKTSASTVGVYVAYADKSSSTGYNTVKLAYITTGDKDVKSGESQYGYLVKAPGIVENKDGDKVVELQLWTGSKVETFNTTAQSFTINGESKKLMDTLNKRDVIKFTANSDGEIDGIDAIIDSDNTSDSAVAAITSFDGQYIRFGSDTTRYEIVKDTVILYIDNDEVVGYEKGNIQLGSDKNSSTKYENACYIANSDNELDLLVIDINNDIANAMD